MRPTAGNPAALALLLALLSIASQRGAGGAPRAVNLLANADFELVDQTTGWPLNWSTGSAFRRSTVQHVAGASASLEYRNADPALYQMITQHVPAGAVQPGHQYTLSADIMAAGLNASAFGGGATICAQWQAPPFYGDYLGGGPAGVTNWTAVSLTFVYPPSAPLMSVAAYVRPLTPGTNRTPTGVAFFGNMTLVHDPPPPMRSEIVSPLYRGRIRHANASAVVRVHLHFELDPRETANVTVSAVLQRRAGGAAIATQHMGPFQFASGRASEQLDFSFPEAGTLSPGEYAVRITCTDGTVERSQLHNFTRLEDNAPPAAVAFDALQRTLVDNQPFFPVGWFFGAGEEMTPGGADFWRFELLSKSAFNTVMPYGESTLANLDAAANLNMKVVSSLKQAYFGLPKADGPWPPAITSIAAERAYLSERILEARNHSALLAWYINDELSQSFLPQIRSHYQLFAELDPEHPTWQVLCEVGHFEDYLGSFDVIGSDPYPIGRPNQGAWGVADEMNDTVVEVDHARPVWELLQAINWELYNPTMCKPGSTRGNSGGSTCHTPNATEVRSMTWQAVAAGANGIFYWEFNDLFRNPDVGFNESFSYFNATATEILRYAPMLLSASGRAPLPVTTVTAPWLLLRAHYWPDLAALSGSSSLLRSHRSTDLDSRVASRSGARVFLLAVSDGRGGGKVTFEFNNATLCLATTQIRVTALMPGQGGAVSAAGCQFTSTIPRLGVQAFDVSFVQL